MMNKFKNERGLTLVELLATFVIGTILISMIFGVHVMIQKQYSKEKDNIQYILDVTTVAKAITKDIRMAEEVRLLDPMNLNPDPTAPGYVEPVESSIIGLKWTDASGSDVNRIYKFESDTVYRGAGAYITDIKDFKFKRNDESVDGFKKIDFFVETKSKKKIETEIVLR